MGSDAKPATDAEQQRKRDITTAAERTLREVEQVGHVVAATRGVLRVLVFGSWGTWCGLRARGARGGLKEWCGYGLEASGAMPVLRRCLSKRDMF